MGTIQTRIEGRVGEAASGSDIVFTTTHMQDAYNHGLRAVIMAMPKEAWEFFGKNEIDFLPIVGTPLTTDKVIRVLRKDGSIYRKCEKIDADMAGVAADSNSIHYASEFTPVYYVDSGVYSNPMLKVLPDDGSKIARMVCVAIPTVDVTTDTIVPHFPDELEELPEIYTTAWIKQREMGYIRRASQDELEAITSSGYIADFVNSLPVFAPPDAPSLPTLTMPTMTALPTLSMSSATDSWPTLTLSPQIVLPALSMPTMEDLPTYVAPTFSATAPSYTAPAKFAFSISDVNDALDKAKNLIDAGASIGGDEADATMSVQDRIDEDLLDHAETTIRTAAQENQRARTIIQREATALQNVAEEIREAIGKFNAENTLYQTEITKYGTDIQESINELRAKTEKVINSYRALSDEAISEFERVSSAQISQYGAISGAEISEFMAKRDAYLNELRTLRDTEIREYQQKFNAFIQEFSAKANAAVSAYSAESQAVLGEHGTLLDSMHRQFTSKLAKARGYLEAAQIRLATMQSFDQKSIAALNEARMLQAEFDKKLGAYIARFQKEPKVVFADRRRQ